jgi:uncharacterized protein (DUF849 family)
MKTIINFAPTGMVHSKLDNPDLPVTINEIVQEVKNAYQMGITIAHIHARDENGAPSSDPKIYSEIIKQIRSFAPDLVICASTSGRINPSFESRSGVLFLDENKPDMASITLSSMNFIENVSINSPQTIKSLALTMKERKIIPEIEIFDLGMANYMKYLISKELLPKKNYINILLGNISGLQTTSLHLNTVLSDLPENSIVSLAGLGRYQNDAINLALEYNLGVRIGLEDNLYQDSEKKTLSSNLEQLKHLHKLMILNKKIVMKGSEFIDLLKSD